LFNYRAVVAQVRRGFDQTVQHIMPLLVQKMRLFYWSNHRFVVEFTMINMPSRAMNIRKFPVSDCFVYFVVVRWLAFN